MTELVEPAHGCASTTHLIEPERVADDPHLLEATFEAARERMEESLSLGRPFLVTNGRRTLVVAAPGQPLKVVGKCGQLRDAGEQDFGELIRSAW